MLSTLLLGMTVYYAIATQEGKAFANKVGNDVGKTIKTGLAVLQNKGVHNVGKSTTQTSTTSSNQPVQESISTLSTDRQGA